MIHHLHYKKDNNIVGYICNNCNLKIKSKKELAVLFHNSKGYDNVYLLNSFSKIPDIRISVIAENQDKYKIIEFQIPEKDYSIEILDSLSFLSCKLDDIGKDLEDDKK